MMRVLDLSTRLSGMFAAQLLAELGAEVTRVQAPPAGWPSLGVNGDAVEDRESDSYHYANRNKRTLIIDLEQQDERSDFLLMLSRYDVLIETFSPGVLEGTGMSLQRLRRASPGIVLASVTPFGQSGPYRDWQASELVLQAMGGIVSATGWEDAPPLRLAGQQSAFIAGINAATAILSAVYGGRAGTSRAVHLDIAEYETYPPHWARHIAQYVYSGTGFRRQIRANGRQGFPDTAMAADGLLYLLALRASWDEMAVFLGLEQFTGEQWQDVGERTRRWPEIDPHFRAAVAGRGKHEWFAAASAQGFTFAPLDGPVEILDSPQMEQRRFFSETAVAGGQEVACPRLPFIRSGV